MAFTIVLSDSATKDLHRLPKSVSDRIIRALTDFAGHPDPVRHAIRKLRGFPGDQPVYRMRVGEYRVGMLIIHTQGTVMVLSVHKREGLY